MNLISMLVNNSTNELALFLYACNVVQNIMINILERSDLQPRINLKILWTSTADINAEAAP